MKSDDSIAITTAEGIEHFQMCSVIGRLSLMTKGLTFKGPSTIQFVQKQYGVTARTAAKAHEQMLAKYKEKYGRSYGSKN